MVNVSTIFNNLKIKVNDLDIITLKAVHADLKKLSDVVDNEAVKNTKFNTLKKQVKKLDKIPDTTNLIYINQ